MDVVWDAMLLVTGRIAMETNCKGDVKEKLKRVASLEKEVPHGI